MVKYSTDENIAISGMFIIACVFCSYCIYKLRKSMKYDFIEKINDIKRDYGDIDITPYIKKLEIKRSNYDRLTR